MSKKFYQAIAEAIKRTPMDGITREELIRNVGGALSDLNDRFNMETFREASIPEPQPIYLEDERM